MQLDRLLQSQGFGTRKICQELVRARRVVIGEETCRKPAAEFSAEGLTFQVDGQTWQYREHAYLILNKPAGHECSQSPRHHPSVLGLLPEPLRTRGVQPVGRLDEDTTGLLLLSDDGQFIHRLTSPKRKVAKVYEVTAKHPVDDAQIAVLLAGVQLHDEPTPIAATACARVSERVIHLTLTEGKYHQVKRMLGAAGNRVEALKRIAVGPVVLGDELAEGQWRWLEADEVAALSGA